MRDKPIIFFDIDYTLFDTARFREKLFKSVSEALAVNMSEVMRLHNRVLEDLAVSKGFFDPNLYAELVAKEIADEGKEKVILNAIQQEGIFLDNYYEETKEVLKKIAEYATIGIFSKGETVFQKRKLRDVEHFFSIQHMHITVDKHKALPGLLDVYPEKRLYFVDDALDVLHRAKMLRKNISVVWVKRGKYAEKQASIEGFTPDVIIENLRELVPFIVSGGAK